MQRRRARGYKEATNSVLVYFTIPAESLLSTVRLPQELLKVNLVLLVKDNTFSFQQIALQPVTLAGERYGGPGVDYPVPGQVVLLGRGVQHPHHLSGCVPIPGHGGNETVSGNLTPGYPLDDVNDLLGKGLFSHKLPF